MSDSYVNTGTTSTPIRKTKTKFIRKYGTPVILRKYGAGVYVDTPTVALLGKGSRANVNMTILENQKEGLFYDEVKSGYYVRNDIHDETYIVGGTHIEYMGNSLANYVANLLLCNSLITIKGQKKKADERGNLKVVFETTCSDLPCYVEEVTNKMRLYDVGLKSDTEYLLYATAIEVAETDQVTMTVRGRSESFKVTAKDYTTFPDLVVIQVKRDIRA